MKIENFLKAQVNVKCELICIFNAIRSGANAVSEFMLCYFCAIYEYFELILELKND